MNKLKFNEFGAIGTDSYTLTTSGVYIPFDEKDDRTLFIFQDAGEVTIEPGNSVQGVENRKIVKTVAVGDCICIESGVFKIVKDDGSGTDHTGTVLMKGNSIDVDVVVLP